MTTDLTTDSERFYNSILELLEDPQEQDDVKNLLTWWNRQIFPAYSAARPVDDDGYVSEMKKKRAAKRAAALQQLNSNSSISQ
ncbi:hypothetical protein HWV62_41268 [Athelia sp. TMB]|nr:hypothetical protein HWV62_41268 [Athelia sp. TMB]